MSCICIDYAVVQSGVQLSSFSHHRSKLRGEWEERVKVIGNLEESLAQVQETFSQREAALLRDRDQAALSAK